MQTRSKTENAWQKKLYLKQNYPDNYTDASFLKLMRKNANVKPLIFSHVVGLSSRVTQQFGVIMMFLGSYFVLSNCSITDSEYYFWLFVFGAFSFLGYILYNLVSPIKGQFWSTVISGLLFSAVLTFMTPILRNLTKDISTDSIWVLTITMLLANMLFHNYDSNADSHTRFPDSLSINAAMFASVLLASRLDTNYKVSLLMLLAVLLFALFPILRRSLRRKSKTHKYDKLMAFVIIGTAVCFFLNDLEYVVIIIGISFGLSFACPLWLVKIQKYKSEIRGIQFINHKGHGTKLKLSCKNFQCK